MPLPASSSPQPLEINKYFIEVGVSAFSSNPVHYAGKIHGHTTKDRADFRVTSQLQRDRQLRQDLFIAGTIHHLQAHLMQFRSRFRSIFDQLEIDDVTTLINRSLSIDEIKSIIDDRVQSRHGVGHLLVSLPMPRAWKNDHSRRQLTFFLVMIRRMNSFAGMGLRMKSPDVAPDGRNEGTTITHRHSSRSLRISNPRTAGINSIPALS